MVKVDKSWYIALVAVSGSIKKLFSIDCVNIANIYVFSIFFSIDFKSVALPKLVFSRFLDLRENLH